MSQALSNEQKQFLDTFIELLEAKTIEELIESHDTLFIDFVHLLN
ncbi:MAG: hypothetical protein ACW98K_01485 [Candidatus Kariarchaeaceae archaeon]|jgi:hypothetical protein